MRKICATLTSSGLLLVIGAVVALPAAMAGDTAKAGGPGGQRTVVMECGTGAFIVGASGSGYATLLGMNLVRSLGFECRSFGGPDGTTPAATVTNTATATANPATGVSDRSQGSASCSSGKMAYFIDVKSGLYIDRVSKIECKAPADLANFSALASREERYLNIGGAGGVVGATITGNNRNITVISTSATKGKSGSYIDMLNVRCGALGQDGRFSSIGSYLSGTAGGTGGNNFGPLSCINDQPARLLRGRAATWVDAIGLGCEYVNTLKLSSLNISPSPTRVGQPTSATVKGREEREERSVRSGHMT